MKVAILGGTGLLSTAITKKCLESGYKVLHFNRGNKKNENIENIRGDRYDAEDLKKVLKYKPDVVIDMLCFNEQHAKLSTNIFRGNIEQYVYCSTSCVYTPSVEIREITENSSTCPLSEYGKNKLCGEIVFKNAMEEGDFNVTIFRPGHVYGNDFLVSNLSFEGIYLLHRMMNDEDIILTERGQRFFQACHCDNVGIAFARSCGCKKAYGKTINIAGQETYTWNDIYNIEKEILNSRSNIIYKDVDEIVQIDRKRLDFLDTYTKYNWIQSTDNLHKYIDGYEYEVTFRKGILQFVTDNEEKIKKCSSEKGLYEKILMG